MAAKQIPEGYHSVTPYLIVHDANAALEYYSKAFDAAEIFRMPMGDRIGHAEIRIGDSVVMLSDEWSEMGMVGPKSRGGTSVGIMLYVQDVDTVFKRALDAGGKEERAVRNEFYGDRTGTLLDPFGHRWFIATHVEDVSAEEMKRRMDEMSKSGVS